MLITVILSGVAVIHFVVLFFTYKPQSKYKNGMLFAVTLPEHAMNDEQIRSIQAKFNKRLRQASLWMAGFFVLFLLLYNWPAYQVIYFLAWVFVSLIVLTVPFRRAFRDTLALKRERDWFVGAKRIIQIDLRAAYLKNQRTAPLWLFVIPFAMAIGLLVWGAGEQAQDIGIGLGAFVLTALLLLISLYTRKAKARVYSTNSDVNVSLNQARRRLLSHMWLILAVTENIHSILLYLILMNESEQFFGVWLAATLLFSAIPIGIVLYTYRSIASQEKETLALDGQTVYTDDDEYWISGFFYHNPQDRSVLVPKRVGVGETVNTATLAGKLMLIIPAVAAVLVVIGVSFLLILSELTSPVLTVTPEQRVKIDYPMYSYEFNEADIEQIELVDSIPSGVKINGEGTNKVARGHFRLNGLGKSRLYIFKNPPYIRIKLPDVYIFYNEKDEQQTKRLFEQLQKQVKK